jgi:hypothetical protein
MPTSRLAFLALAAACLAAAAGGGYLAQRQNATSAVVTALSQTTGTPTSTVVATATELSAVNAEAPVPEQDPTPVAARASAVAPKRVEPSRPVARGTVERTSTPALGRPPTSESAPTLERPPTTAANSTAQGAVLAPVPPAASAPSEPALPAARSDDRIAQDPPHAQEPVANTFEELVIAADSVIGLQAETSVSTERARVEDRVEARVTRDVRVRGMVAVASGARAIGSVVSVERGGRFSARARLGIRFNTIILADGTRLAISTETIYREGDPPGKDSAAKIGGATVGGAILGAILGGGKGAAIGATAGAGVGSAAVLNSDRSAASLHSGEPITVRIVSPVTVTIEPK